jgi:AcrR family transcriptional regulator
MRPRIDRNEVRARILKTANHLFRRYGHAKTTVADIAAELGMSPANIYKFFPSREAIVEACAEINIAHLQASLVAAIARKRKAQDKLEAYAITMIRDHKEAFRNERELYALIMMANENRWPCIQAFLAQNVLLLGEILEEGNRAQDFRVANVKETAQLLFDSLQAVVNPLLTQDIAQSALEKKARALLRFLSGALR